MYLLINLLVILICVHSSSSIGLNIKINENYQVKLNFDEHGDYCLAKFITRNDAGKAIFCDHRIDQVKNLDIDMPWLSTGYDHTVCLHKGCKVERNIQPICKKFSVPR